MKKRNLITTIISILCICSLLAANLTNGPAIISKASENGPVEQKTPEEMGYERLTIEDFNISAATHSATAYGSYGSDTGASALNGKYLDVNVQVSSAVDSDNANRISYGGGGDGVYWWGLRVAIYEKFIYFGMAVNKGTAGAYTIDLPEGVSATDEMNLKIATNVVGADLQVDVWLNDVRQERMTFTGCAGEMGNWLGFIVSEDNTFTISTPDVLKVKEYSGADYKSYRSNAGTPEAMGYERLTIEDFNISAATHSATAYGSYGSDTGASALNGKYLDVNVQVSSAVSSDEETRISYGGGGDGVYWWGLRVAIYADSIYFGMAVNKGTAGAYAIALPEGVSATDKLNLKIATNVVGEDLQVDVWLNDKYQKRMTFTGCAGELGNWLGFIVSGATTFTISTPEHLENPTYTAPVEDGYLFAGWYADEACTKPFAEKTAEQNVYAKFVPKSVFTVKAQITAGLQETDEMGDIRFLTTVESKNYAKVGFDITIEGFEKQTIPFTTVYKQLYMVSVNPETEEKTLDTIDAQEEFSSLSKYFVAYAYWNVPNTAFGSEFTVTPWWVTEDGTLVYGETVTKSVYEGITKQNGGVEPYVAL